MKSSAFRHWAWALVAALAVQLCAHAANTAPAPSAPGLVTQQNTTATTQVTANDVDVGDTATYAIASNPSHGSASVSSTGLVTYTPTTNYYGNDSLQVRVTDNNGAAGLVTISIFVRGALIPTSLPERVRFDANIVAACQTTITLKYPATVEAYFLDEGAGDHNTLGWYDVTNKSVKHQLWYDASSVLDLLGLTDGTLHTGDRAELGTFSGGETIGFYLRKLSGSRATMTSDSADNSDGLKHVLIMAIPNSDFVLVAFEDRPAPSDYDYNDEMILLRIGQANVQNWIDTSTRPLVYVAPTKYQTVLETIEGADTDGDGVPDSLDQFPLDPTRAFLSFVPTPDAMIITYEDEFPIIGDYDFNDAVISYHVAYVTNASNQLVEIRGDAKLLAHGAAMSHDWHLRFIGSSFSATATVTQTPGKNSGNTSAVRTISSAVSVDPSKTEIDLPMILDTGASLPWKSGNTVPGWVKGDGDSASFSIVFTTPIDPSVIESAPFDPYLFVRESGLEIHLPNLPLRKNSTNPKGTRTFINAEGMPWALMIPANWNWPTEKTDIRTSFPRFTSWTGSAGAQDVNWYLTPLQADVVQTPLLNDHSIWAANQTPSVSKRSIERFTVPAGFDFSSLATRRLNLVSREKVVVSLLPLGANPADVVKKSVATFTMQGNTVRDVRVPAAWQGCMAVVTPAQGNAWEMWIDWSGGAIDVSSTAADQMRMAVVACQVKVSPDTNKAAVLLSGGINPALLNVTESTSGTLYLGGAAIPFGNGAAPIKIKTATTKSNAPWNTFTIKAANVDVSAWANNGVVGEIGRKKTITRFVTIQSGGVTLFGDATIFGK